MILRIREEILKVRRFSLLFSILICGLFVMMCRMGGLVLAQDEGARVPGAVTASQIEEGAGVYSQKCANCHGANLEGGVNAPALTGGAFQAQWRSRTVNELFANITETMPPGNRGSLNDQDGFAVTAFLLQRNRGTVGGSTPAGAPSARITEILNGLSAIPSGPMALNAAASAGGRAGRYGPRMDAAAEARFAQIRKPLDKLTPVTDAMLRDPSPNDWLMWRRTYNAWGYSPLKQINRDNVKDLRVAWTWGLNSTGITEFTPLVHDGILFVWNYGETIQALDARNGNLLWQFHHDIPATYERDTFYRTKRSLAIGGDKLIFPTTDMHIIALDVKTGKVVWDVVTGRLPEEQPGLQRWPFGDQRQGDYGRQRLRAWRSGLFRGCIQPGQRQGAVEIQYDCAAR